MALPNFNILHKFALLSKTSASNVLVSFSAYFASSIYISCHSSLWIIFPLISKNHPYQNISKYVLNLIHLFILHFFIFIFSESILIHLIFLYLTSVFFFFYFCFSLFGISYFYKCIYYLQKFSRGMSLGIHCMKDIKHNQISLLFFIFKKIKSSSINLHIKVVFSGSLSRVLQYMGPYKAKEVYTHLDSQREILIIDIKFLWNVQRWSDLSLYIPNIQYCVCFGTKRENYIWSMV